MQRMTDSEILEQACIDGQYWFQGSGFSNIQEAMDSGRMPEEYYLWCCQSMFGLRVDPELINNYAKEDPTTALVFAAEHLTPDLLEHCRNNS